MISETPDILNSWKEIAAYLGRGVRTVQRWERELHLPIRRPRNKSHSAVIALRSELDEWVASTTLLEKATALPTDPEKAEEILQRQLLHLRAEAQRIQEEIKRLRVRNAQENRSAKAKAA